MNISKALNSAFEAYQQRNFQKAEEISKKILRKQPRHGDVLHLLGMIFFERGDHKNAIAYIQKALQIDPDFPAAFNNLGNVYQSIKRFNEAIACYQKAVALNPNLAQTHMNLGIVLQDDGKLEEAVKSYRRVIEIKPDHFGAYNNLGLALQMQGKTDESITCYQKALQINSRFPDAYNNLATAYKNKGQRDYAKSCYQQAISLNPRYAEAFNNLGLLLKEEGYLDDAIASYQKALIIRSDYAEAYNNLGAAYQAKGHLSEAIINYQKAIGIDSHYAHVCNNLGTALKDAGNLLEAERYFRRALQIQSDYSVVYSNILFTMNYDNTYDPGFVFSEHVRFAEQFEKPLLAHHFSFTNEPIANRRLRIGYVSPDFRTHSVAYFFEPVLFAHDHDNFEIFCFSDVVTPDDATKRMEGLADNWLTILGKSDDIVAELIRKHSIDILVDLAGHTGNNRMLLFARKPAPVQVTWIGYPTTTGLSSMDYKIVDGYTDPPGMTDQYYSETLIQMPESFLCYAPPADCPEIAELPASSTGQICFGSFNNFSKVSAATVAMWEQILQSVPDARLLLKAKCFADEQTQRHTKEKFAVRNIDISRIDLLPWESAIRPHLALYNQVDIALDTFPYNGTTTTCEALWMGVPVITLAGKTHAARVGASLLANAGLPELIAHTSEEYVSKAVSLARDIKKLQLLKKSLRPIMSRSPLTDAKRLTGNLEGAYRKIWADWCAQAERNKKPLNLTN